MYLSEDKVASLARDLAASRTLRWWIIDLHSPGLLRFIASTSGQSTAASGAPMKFGPADGPEFFVPYGWKPVEVHRILQAAIRTKRLPPEIQVPPDLQQSSGRQGDQFWSGICLLQLGE